MDKQLLTYQINDTGDIIICIYKFLDNDEAKLIDEDAEGVMSVEVATFDRDSNNGQWILPIASDESNFIVNKITGTFNPKNHHHITKNFFTSVKRCNHIHYENDILLLNKEETKEYLKNNDIDIILVSMSDRSDENCDVHNLFYSVNNGEVSEPENDLDAIMYCRGKQILYLGEVNGGSDENHYPTIFKNFLTTYI